MLADPDNPPDQPVAVDRRRTVDDTIAGTDIYQRRLHERPAGIGNHVAGDKGAVRRQADIVECAELGVLLLKLAGGLAPGAQTLDLAPEFAVLVVDIEKISVNSITVS